MAMGMFKNIEPSDVEAMLVELYNRRNLDGLSLEPFYKSFYEDNKETIRIAYEMDKFNLKQPEYYIGMLEVAYKQLLKLYEIDIEHNQLRDFEADSMTYRRSTK